MKKYLIIFGIIFLTACASSKRVVYVPTQAETKIEYRDTTIHIRDTIRVEIPKEVIREVIPIVDTSRLETSVAKSQAWIDTVNKKLMHNLENKKTNLKTKVDTVVIVKTKNEYIEKPVIQEVEVPVKYIPKIYNYSLWFSIAVIAFVLGRFILKFKKII